jgi:hypothetical protein
LDDGSDADWIVTFEETFALFSLFLGKTLDVHLAYLFVVVDSPQETYDSCEENEGNDKTCHDLIK